MMLTTGQEPQSTELLPLTVAEEFDTRPQGEAKAGRTWAGSPHVNDSVESVGEDSEEGPAPAVDRSSARSTGSWVLGYASLEEARVGQWERVTPRTPKASSSGRKGGTRVRLAWRHRLRLCYYTRRKAADERRGQTFGPWARITVEVPSRLPASGQPAWREGTSKLVVDVETLQTTVDSRLAERLIRGAESGGERGTETFIAGPATVPILPSSRETWP
ncbi:hypothetical protein CMUS01_00855 [Colletotrichum musicola]|uniref:Uncharacterized protein n=1 Tax=Colletotrichum musicola TaxID=2175873 RepID=A0A8H6U946_9PEZI|nr:hypothetical protein CMUS01_00855 [Colletotrichum musicola]